MQQSESQGEAQQVQTFIFMDKKASVARFGDASWFGWHANKEKNIT